MYDLQIQSLRSLGSVIIFLLLCATSVFSVSLWLVWPSISSPQRHRGHRGYTEKSEAQRTQRQRRESDLCSVECGGRAPHSRKAHLNQSQRPSRNALRPFGLSGLPESPLQSWIVPILVPGALARGFRQADTDEPLLDFLLTGIFLLLIWVRECAVTPHVYPAGRESSPEPSRLRRRYRLKGNFVINNVCYRTTGGHGVPPLQLFG
jgi:hypothetical protein